MKRKGLLLLAVAIFSSFAFGGGKSEGSASSAKKTYNINVASVYAAEGNIHEGMVKFKQLVENKTQGRMKVTIHVAGAMGGEREVVEGISNGTIEMGAHGGMDIMLYTPEYSVFEEMFVIRDLDHLEKFWNTIGKEISEDIAKRKGILTVGTVPRGSRYVTANKPLKTPNDLKGLKFRLPDYPIRIKYFESLGALPTIIAFPELHLALKTGVVDGQENPPETIYNYKYYEAQKYLIATRHLYSSNRYAVSKKWLDRLDPEDQKMILDSWEEATKYARELVKDPDAFYIDKLVNEKGMVLIEPDREAFVKAIEPILQQYDKQWAPGLRERIRNIK
ncbi:MAG: TRAP transporter substrate-binding protein [Spirochaetales bacterium]|nr:TRAP transporter substrate-binding protein [Spirochaetales bacterium]